MSFKTVLNTALREKVITPEMKKLIEESLFTLTFDEEDMRSLQILLTQIVAGEVEVLDVS